MADRQSALLTITICSIVERKVGVYKEIVEGDNNL